MQYKELKQRKLREETILKSLEESNEKGIVCSYSEEQILEAQKQDGKKQINLIYEELINPATNNILYVIYSLVTLILMPIIYLNDIEGSRIAAVAAYILMIILLITMQTIRRSVEKDTEKNRDWIKYFNKFSNDTAVFNYIVTSFGYLMIIMEVEIFWYIYIAMSALFLLAMYFDFLKPLAAYIWQRFWK